jgi:hypothetical protein
MEPLYTVVVIIEASMKICMEIPQKTKNRTTI